MATSRTSGEGDIEKKTWGWGSVIFPLVNFHGSLCEVIEITVHIFIALHPDMLYVQCTVLLSVRHFHTKAVMDVWFPLCVARNYSEVYAVFIHERETKMSSIYFGSYQLMNYVHWCAIVFTNDSGVLLSYFHSLCCRQPRALCLFVVSSLTVYHIVRQHMLDWGIRSDKM
jgi:hypothetical protein